jgi:SAM-dependent methyltransferase
MEPARPADFWASAAAYEPYVGRWSRRVARVFLAWLAAPPGGRWLDMGCGTVALTATILEQAAPHMVIGLDRSLPYATYARAHIGDRRACFASGEAQALPVAPACCDCAVSGLVLNFVPDPARAVAELARVTRPGGTVAVYVWDYAGEMQLMRYFWDAAGALDPAARALAEGLRFSLCAPAPLTALFRAAGLADVAVLALDVPTLFRDFDDYWQPFLGGQGPAPAYTMSLPDTARAALRERLRATLPIQPDGTIPLMARAWGVRGTRAARAA